MNRYSLRIQSDIKTKFMLPEGGEHQIQLCNIGLGGAYFRLDDALLDEKFEINSIHRFKIELDRQEGVSLKGKIVRNDGEGVGLCFVKMGQDELISLWQYLIDIIGPIDNCPYCNALVMSNQEKCAQCNWKLNFADRDYLTYWKRESLLRNMSYSMEKLPFAELRKLARQFSAQHPTLRQSIESAKIDEFVGTCKAMRDVFSLIRKVSVTDLPVLILGESGTGKELTARAIHDRSDRSDGPFIPINCAAIPAHLIESELFGHTKGAFTGAHKEKKGKFEYADQGTLFLDEIGDFPIELQPKLLRFLETQQIESVGGNQKKRLNVRILAATNRDLDQAIDDNQFRPDLYYRIKVFTINLPPLRDRGDDKVVLAKFFLKRIKTADAWGCKGFTPEALDAIQNYAWPGNVRELINSIRRALVVQDQWIKPGDLELDNLSHNHGSSSLKVANDKMKKDLIVRALKESHYNVTRAAKSLGISRQHLYVLKKRFDIEFSTS